MKKLVPVEEAVGCVLPHDITEIIPGKRKGRAYKRGRVIRPEDVPRLLKLGKKNIYVMDLEDGLAHEDEAAERIASLAGPGLSLSEPCEGKVNLTAQNKGLLKINVKALGRLNEVEDIILGTLRSDQTVNPGTPVAGTRIIPLVTAEENLKKAEDICRENSPLIQVKPFIPHKAGLIVTGSEVYEGKIKDQFSPVVEAKFEELGSRVIKQTIVNDDIEMTAAAIKRMIDEGADIIALTGGMSVDPDDNTPAAIRAAGGQTTVYGAPVFPGAMFMLAYIGDIPLIGLPGCVMYYKSSIFDLVVPRILAGEKPTKKDFIALGHGGFCSNCHECRFPNCGFGKG